MTWGLSTPPDVAVKQAVLDQLRGAVRDHLAAIDTWTALGHRQLVGAHRAALLLVLRALDNEERESAHWSAAA